MGALYQAVFVPSAEADSVVICYSALTRGVIYVPPLRGWCTSTG